MKKITLAILMILSSFSIASAELGINVGASGLVGLYEVSGKEVENAETNTHKAQESLAGMASVFIEKDLTFLPGPLSRLTVGYDKVLHKIESGSESRMDRDLVGYPATTGNTGNGIINDRSRNTLKVSLDNIRTVYVTANLTDWLFIRSGRMSMDIETQENLDSGSKYGNTSTDGTILSAGLNFKTDGGIFTRMEVVDTSLDGVSVKSSTNADNTVTLDGIDGTSYRVSIGKAF
jgi:hypothetical protein